MGRIVFLSLMLLPGLAFASAKDSFNALNTCVQQGEVAQCRPYLTANSFALYDRFTAYGLLDCLPGDVTFTSQTREGKETIIRAQTKSLGAKPKNLRLAFAEEEGQWKLDIPSSLHAALGDKWEGQVDVTEKLYLALKSQLGDAMGCQAVTGLLKK